MLGMSQDKAGYGRNAMEGLMGQANAYQAHANSLKPETEAPRTLASAISRMDGLNERLGEVHGRLSSVADLLGALRSVPPKGVGEKPAASGAIHRLNDSADVAHSQLADIEDLLAAISGALG